MRFKRLDLNLLVALDVLLTEMNVSRAAEKLHLSQSATSGALARLREYFNDDLLVQVGRKMVLSPRARELSAKVRASLMQIERTIIQSPDFDPATVDRTISIVASDYVVISELSEAFRRIQAKAPNIKFSLDPPRETPAMALARGDVDLLAMPEVYLAPDHPSAHYFTDDYVVLAWEGNTTFGESITRAQFFAAQHVTMKFSTHSPSFEDWFVKNSGVERKIAAVAGSFTAVPFLLLNTQNIALFQHKLARIFADLLPLRILPVPIDIPPLVEHLQWHSYSEGDECLRWVRSEILAARSAI